MQTLNPFSCNIFDSLTINVVFPLFEGPVKAAASRFIGFPSYFILSLYYIEWFK
jgi:hypothetical protein